MGSRLKEDERNERTIRNLLKLPANKKCINCNSLGPQYVCTNFWTFICTTCSGIHREFPHRVKSVSMAKFTSQEVSALQSGGNERAKSIYFKDWDTQGHSYPNNSNIERLRDFIRHVYIDRRFSGERSFEKPPKGEDSYENRSDASRSGSQSPPYEDTYDHRRNNRPSPGGRSDESYPKYDNRSPEHDREIGYSSDQRKIPNRPQIVNDWRREDRFSNARKVDDFRTSDADSVSDGRSPDHQNDIIKSSPPVVRPIRDILGDKFIPLKIGPPGQIGAMSTDAPGHVVRNASSSSFGSSEGNQVEPKKGTLESLIDFDADPAPPAVAASKPQIEQTHSILTTVEQASSISDDNWASFDFATEAKLPHLESSSVNTVDSLLMQLTTLSSVPAQSGPLLAPGGASQLDALVSPVNMPPFSAVGFTAAPISTSVAFGSMQASGSDLFMQYQTHSHTSGGQISHSIQQPSNFAPVHLPQSISKSSQEIANGFEMQTQHAETKASERSALPEDLFAVIYHQPLAASQGWPTSHPTGMGFAMQYSVPDITHSFQQPTKSSNPFDFGNESSPAPALTFPSMAPLHGALPNMGNPSAAVARTPSVSPHPSYVQPPMSSHTSQFPPSHATAMLSSVNNGYLTTTAPNSFPGGGNPFG